MASSTTKGAARKVGRSRRTGRIGSKNLLSNKVRRLNRERAKTGLSPLSAFNAQQCLKAHTIYLPGEKPTTKPRTPKQLHRLNNPTFRRSAGAFGVDMPTSIHYKHAVVN